MARAFTVCGDGSIGSPAGSGPEHELLPFGKVSKTEGVER